MNFTTDLPKRQPVVQYLVASAYHRHPLTAEANPYRMHVVRSLTQPGPYLLCHVRQVTPQDTPPAQEGLAGCLIGGGRVNFMRLFTFLHYHCHQ